MAEVEHYDLERFEFIRRLAERFGCTVVSYRSSRAITSRAETHFEISAVSEAAACLSLAYLSFREELTKQPGMHFSTQTSDLYNRQFVWKQRKLFIGYQK